MTETNKRYMSYLNHTKYGALSDSMYIGLYNIIKGYYQRLNVGYITGIVTVILAIEAKNEGNLDKIVNEIKEVYK